ncbi:hypothetical protein C8R43DRAFT_1009675 [Mycena crocata]|nr:hypothetical protein C8R43DRAFT_1009675 [Mycena crocata]
MPLCDLCNIPLLSDTFPSPTQTEAVQDFLRSTRLPSDPSYYHSQIASSTAVLARYETEIEKAEKILQDLRFNRARVQDYVAGCRAVVAPVRRLPPEILCEIFVSFSLSLRKTTNHTEELDNLAKSNLMHLSNVCSNWHKLITGTPRLWSHIAVNLSYWPTGGPHLDLLKRSLERGARHRLAITFHSLSGDSPMIREAAFALLAEHSRRWQSLALSINDWSHLPNLSLIEGKLDNLRALSFRSRNSASAKEVIVFETAPKLARVIIYNAVHTNEIAPLFALMRHAQPDAVFGVRNFNADTFAPLSAITSPITTFELVTGKRSPGDGPSLSQAVGDVLDSLTLPHLRKLKLKADFPTRLPLLWPTTQFVGLSHRSSFSDTLQSLNIRHVTITEDDLILSLTSLSSLQRLTMSDQQRGGILLTDALLRRLALTSDHDSSLVTQLNFLDCTSVFKFSTQAYLDFAVARTAHAPSFHVKLRDFSDRSCRFDAANHQRVLNFIAEHQLKSE